MSSPVPGSERPAFTNETVAVDALPALDVADFEAISPAYIRIRLIGLAGFVAVVLLAAAIATSLTEMEFVVAAIVVGAGLALALLMAVMQWMGARRMGFLIRTHDFSFRRGVLWRQVDTMPFARIQHVVIRRGPVERLFGLATLNLRSAGGSMYVVGLDDDRAERLKALVVERAGELADRELTDGEAADGNLTGVDRVDHGGDDRIR